jgi:hypothetical protein
VRTPAAGTVKLWFGGAANASESVDVGRSRRNRAVDWRGVAVPTRSDGLAGACQSAHSSIRA